MQLIKDLWAVVQAILQVVKTLVSYVRLAIHGVENLIGKLTAKKATVAAVETTPETQLAGESTPPVVNNNNV
jgi:hypothetical protein